MTVLEGSARRIRGVRAAAASWAGPPKLSIGVFGPLRLSRAGQDVPVGGRKAQALLGYLALAARGEETRERLVRLLWSEADEDRARASLRGWAS